MEKLRRALPAVLGLVLFAVALVVLRKELHAVTWQALTSDVLATPASRLLAALVLTVLNYAVLSGYDLLAFAYIGNPLSRWRVAGASLLAYAVANSVGFAMFSGAAVRYRFYTRWGVTAQELSRIVFSYSVTFWLGLLALGGFSLVASPLPEAHELPAHALVAPVGWLLLLTSVGYLVAVLVRRAADPPVPARAASAAPADRLRAARRVGAGLDARRRGALRAAAEERPVVPGSAGGLPGGPAPRPRQPRAGRRGCLRGLDGAAAQALSLVCAAPARAGRLPRDLLPAAAGDGPRRPRRRRAAPAPRTDRARGRLPRLAQRRDHAARPGRLHVPGRGWPALLGRHAGGAGPPAPGSTTCCPSVWSRSPTSSAASSARACCSCRRGSRGVSMPRTTWPRAGLRSASRPRSSRGRTTRRPRCWPYCSWSCGARGPPSIAGRRFFDTRFSAGWIVAVVGTLGASVWLGLFAFKHVEYSHELWWQFELGQEASRFLRSSVGAAVAVALFGFGRLMRPAPHEAPEPTDADLEAAGSRDRRAGLHAPVPRVPAGQGPALRRRPQGLRDVRRPGADLGRARGSRRTARPACRTDSTVPGTLRRLRRGPGLLRGRQGRPPPLRRLRPDLRQARRRGESGSPVLLPRWGAGQQAPSGAQTAREGGRDASASSPPPRCPP